MIPIAPHTAFLQQRLPVSSAYQSSAVPAAIPATLMRTLLSSSLNTRAIASKTSVTLNCDKPKATLHLCPKCACIISHGMQKDLHVDSCQVKCGPLPCLLPPFVGIRVARSHSHSLTSLASESSIRDSMHVCNSATTTGTSRTRFSPIRF